MKFFGEIMGRRFGRKRPKIAKLSPETALTCGCDARDEPTGTRGWYPREVMSFGDDEPGKDIRGERIMLQYHDGTMRHKRCGRISSPVPKLERFFDVLDEVLKRIDNSQV